MEAVLRCLTRCDVHGEEGGTNTAHSALLGMDMGHTKLISHCTAPYEPNLTVLGLGALAGQASDY